MPITARSISLTRSLRCWRSCAASSPSPAPGSPTILRWHLGYAQIPQHCASLVKAFCADCLNPYVNFHRPCFFPETITDAKGTERTRYRYEDMNTPDEKLKSLSNARQHLTPGVTVEHLDAIALRISDKAAAVALNHARRPRFQAIAGAIRKQA